MVKPKKAPVKHRRKPALPAPPPHPPMPDGAGPEAMAAYYRTLDHRSTDRQPKKR